MNHLIPAEFHGITLNIIDHNGKKWLTAEQIGLCLGYADGNARIGIMKIHERHADEFTDVDTCVVNLTTQGQQRALRIFSSTGCIKLGFFANTARAKEFRAWAAQVLDGQTQPQAVAVNSASFDLMARNMAKLAGSMEMLLRQNNRTDRYVALLELNQRGHVKVTEDIRRQVYELYSEGMPQASIARLLRISAATVNQLIKGTYMAGVRSGIPVGQSYAQYQAELDVAIERKLAEEKASL